MSLNFYCHRLWAYGLMALFLIASIMFAGGRWFISSFFIKSMHGAT